ncbi:MAG: ComEA family DNA-binding protein [Marinobacter sp.]|uniref:ComEA family DNA-binding protein n=1 Tax=Marinobacter sp. TaxID=50741 RepID=UPI003F9AA18F
MKHTPLFATLVLLFSLVTGLAYAEEPTVNINNADAITLAGLDGIGASKAEDIIAYREANGPFENAQDLSKVKGIGARTIEKNSERLTVK